MPARFKRLPAAALLLAGGCTRWTTLASPYPDQLPDRRQVQVWTSSGRVQLQAVQIHDQILSGVPFTSPPTCDSCRLTVPLETVDSIRVGDHESTGFMLGALPFVILLGAVIAMRVGMSGD